MAKATVLLAEDNADMRALLQWLLESEGYDVKMAEDGAAALNCLSQFHPDAILTDLMMPQVDGIELIRQVRNTPEYADIPIVAMTAYGNGYMNLANKVGANAAIRKPEDLDRLIETLNQVLPDHSPAGH